MLRVASYIVTILVGPLAAAGTFDFVKGDLGAAMNDQRWSKALDAWGASHPAGDEGRALHALIVTRLGLPITGLSELVSQTRPKSLSAPLLKIVSEELRTNRFTYEGWVSTKGPWASVLDNSEPKVRLNSKGDVAKAFARVNATPKTQIVRRTRVLWQIATRAPLLGETGSALRALDQLRGSDQKIIAADMISLTAGRVLYQRGDLEGAARAFDEIGKDSNLWTTALEERAWANVRASNYDKALGQATTLLSPALDPLVGPEPYFLSNLMSLRTCDYVRLFKTSDTFKARHRARLSDMQELATKGTDARLEDVIARTDKNGLNILSIGPAITAIPRLALRDRSVRQSLEMRKQFLVEAKLAEDLKLAHAEALAAKAEAFKKSAVSRLRVLAKDEVAEYRQILNKLHILEAEVIERLHLDDNLKGERSKLAQTEKVGRDQLVFPYRSDEVWFDELDNYHAQVKDCPTIKGAGL